MADIRKLGDLPYNAGLKERARELRKAGNKTEVLFWKQVKNKQFLGLDFDRQKIIGNYIVDFYCHAKKLVFEIDGSSHDDKIEYDQERESYLKGLGLNIIRFQDIQIRVNLEAVIRQLTEYIKTL